MPTWFMVMLRPERVSLSEISDIGSFLASLAVMCRNSKGEPKVNVSMSSDPTAKARPALTNAEHCASASPGA